MKPRPPLRVAGLGAGYFSQFHYGSWARIPEVELVGAADRNVEAAQATGLPAFQDAETLLAATQPHILDVILPPSEQRRAVEVATNAGVAVIICQKPFGADIEEAVYITEMAEKSGSMLVIHENFRFMPWHRAIKRAIQNGLIGTALQATFRLRPGDGQGPHAYLDRQPYFRKFPRLLVHETAVHWIDTFRFIFGSPTAVYSDLRQINPVIKGEDAGFVLFDHPCDVRTLFDGNRLLDHQADNLRRTMGEGQFEGTKGCLTLTGDGSVTLRSFGDRQLQVLLEPDDWPGFGGDCVHALQTHVVSGFLGGTVIENTAREYLEVIRIKDAIYRSAQTGAKIRL